MNIRLFSMQIYTNFESNSQQKRHYRISRGGCFRCKFTQILKAIHNNIVTGNDINFVVFDANLHKF